MAVLVIHFLKLGTAKTMKSKKRKKYAPLRSFSWSENEDVSTDQKLIESTIVEWYDAKHREISTEEIDFINSISIQCCPLCKSKHIVKSGHRKNGIQRYLCKNCKSRFTPLTNTIFDSKKIPISEWIEFLLHLFEFYSVQSTAYDNRNSPTTTKYWLLKVFEALKGIQDEIILDGTIYLDETYFSKTKSQTIIKDGRKLRGISRNKIGVGVACNDKQFIFIATNASKPTRLSTKRTYENI